MIGEDPTGKESESMTRAPIAPEPLNRSAASFADTEASRVAGSPWQQAPTGRRISFTAWGAAAVVGVLLWMVIIKLA